MKAIGFERHLPVDHPEAFRAFDLPVPEPGTFDLRVAVEAVSVNPVDTKVRAPRHADPDHPDNRAHPAPRVLGFDALGVVDAVGASVTRFQPGDVVYYAGDIGRPGSNAEFQLVDEAIVGHAPRGVDSADAAALPLTALTAWETLFDRLGLSPDGEDAGTPVLLINGAGGVGSMAIQLARDAGLKVIATASRPESRQWCLDLGAVEVVDHFGDLPAQLAERGIREIPAIACFNDLDRHYTAMAELVAPQGRLASIVGNKSPLPFQELRDKSVGFFWEYMFTRPRFDTPDKGRQGEILDTVAAMVEEGRVLTTRHEVLGTINAENLRAAHRALEGGHVIGKIVLAGFDD
ncbi:zinc-binding alcohol dehydrogenase family protein [Guyparkeria hydrothermalis]|uniref:zinc-binding alcohol dehydrogenase family protein n=1 Tax=Guyparkeria hydrothermalis TaxID=923 RepID=UPI002020F9C0|nr:zinc-binding alcohol dehydrogenase family protein [Guyparkeria hydrothermalis]MCL7745305.1 zinc-binding alcohol dehydrogenase family protein [Guyparkeria hydrothermalis]